MKKSLLICGFALFAIGIPIISPIVPETASADIYQWRDDSDTLHFTDKPSNIPKKYRSSQKKVQNSPSDRSRPGLTIIESTPSTSSFDTEYESPPPIRHVPQESLQSQAEQLQGRITAKEKFIEGIDRKRSHTLNPMGNRFVSPEDLELYNKYSEELPQDRQRLGELQSYSP